MIKFIFTSLITLNFQLCYHSLEAADSLPDERTIASALQTISIDAASQSSSLLTSESVLASNILSQLNSDHASGYANIDTVFERVIGLGSDCMTKGQINTYLNPTSDWRSTKKGHADLFDWMIIYDYDLLAEALLKKLKDLFEEEDFDAKIIHGWKTLVNRRYNMHWNHLFNQEYEGYWVKNDTGEFSMESISPLFQEIKKKITYLIDKFIASKNSKTLYVIHDKYYTFSKEVILKLRESIVDIRDGDKNFAILLVGKKINIENFQNVYFFESTKVPSGWDSGDPIRWKEILDQFKFTPDIWA